MKSMSLYVEKDSIIHNIDPISKILYVIVAIAVPFILPIKNATLIFMLISFIILALGRVFRKVIPLLGFVTIVVISIVIIQGLFYAQNKTYLFNIGPLKFYREGLIYAMHIFFNVYNLIAAFAILILTTKPSDMVECLVRRGLNAKIGYVLSSVFQIIPQMSSTMETITDAQRSRGMETEGKLLTRIKAFFPLIGPVVLNSLISTRERAMALEVRGFNSKTKKTFINEEKHRSSSTIIQIILVLIIIIAIIWRIIK